LPRTAAPAGTLTPPIAAGVVPRPIAGTAASNSQVDAWDEVTHLCKPGDTYEKISARYYQTEDYAAALQQFNHQHGRTSDAVKRDGPVPGDTVFIPPSSVLERKFGTALPAKAAPPTAPLGLPGQEPPPAPRGTLPAPAPVPPAAPVGLPSRDPAPPTPPPAPPGPMSAAPTPAPEAPRFQVKADGQRLRDVAAATLSDRERWGEIAALNRSVNPELAVPPGTILALPTGARVPAQNVPQ
jgi:hypothetical protein